MLFKMPLVFFIIIPTNYESPLIPPTTYHIPPITYHPPQQTPC
jgi:hypothetical protein